MSSNIRIKRICEFCEKEFEARKTTSKTCSDHCAKMLYKAKKRKEKIDISNSETVLVRLKPIEEIKSKEFLTVKDVAKLLNCSKQTIYNLIKVEKIKATNISIKKTLIKRKDIDTLFV